MGSFDEDFAGYVRPVKAADTSTSDSAFDRDFAGYKRPDKITTTPASASDMDFSYSDIPVPQNVDPKIAGQVDADIGSGIARGATNVGEGISKLQLAALHKVGAISDDTYKATKDLKAARLNEYNAKYGDNYAAKFGSILGEAGATAPFMLVGGELAGAGASALGGALPALESAGNYIQGNRLLNYAANGLKGAAQGAGGNLLISGGSNEDLGDQAANGAKLGAALGVGVPVVADIGDHIGNVITSAIHPFTTSGQKQLASSVIAQHAGNPLAINANEIVPGSTPTLAEATGNAGIAGLQRAVRDLPGSGINQFVEREQGNATARSNLLQKIAGTPEDVEAVSALRATQADQDLKNAFASKQSANPANVVNTIDNILSGPGGKRDAVISSLNNIRSKIVNGDGTLETDPETLYQSVRKQIGDLLDKKDLTNQAGKQAASELITVRDSLDKAIESGAPGFKDYLNNYTSSSAPINSMEWLQGLKLTDAQGNITLSKVQNALQNVNKLKSASGVNAAKSLTGDQVNSLQAIRDDLLRKENINLGKSPGSNTVQNIGSQNFMNSILPGNIGNFIVRKTPLGPLTSKLMGSQDEAIQNQLRNMLLNPETYNPGSGSNVVRNGVNPLTRLIQQNYIPAAAIAVNNARNNRKNGSQP